jgi:hypothetical protein
MLDLHVKTTSQQEHQVAISSDVMRSDDLMREKVLVELLCVMRGQVIDLRGDHETYGEEVDRHHREEKTPHCQTVQVEGQRVNHQEVEYEPQL